MFEELGEMSVASEELKTLEFWKETCILQRTIEWRKDSPHFVFFEGPPTANGSPGIHHCLSRIYKDTVCRYKTQTGYRVDRKAGWDTHGLPVEIQVEKELGLSGKEQIEDYGIEAFIKKCKESVFKYESEWEQLTDRIAFWLDFKQKYMTLTNNYVESLWHILSQIWKKDLLYQGYKVVPYCPRCGTTLSSHEVAQGYKDDTKDPSITVKMELIDEPGTYFLVWTTTPWTLPANVAVAVKASATYAMVKYDGEKYILAKNLIETHFKDKEYEVLYEFPGSQLEKKSYKPLFGFIEPDKPAHYVTLAEYVGTEDGTGIVHIAPAFGADDMDVAREYDLPVILTIDQSGRFIPEVAPWKGQFVKDADPEIIVDIKKRGLLFSSGKIFHTYPFCWRCDSPLLYYAKPSWYVKMSKLRENLIKNNQTVNWYPSHIKDGRFGEWLREVKDWAISRERYWGTPIPIWTCPDCDHKIAISSIAELKEKSHNCPDEIELHRPYVDKVEIKCEKCGGTMKRVPEVADCWFDSGSMPYAQWHWPFDNKELFESHFPADFISEAIDQTRGWFYTLMAVSTILFDKSPYKDCVCLELIVDENGQKMSKSRGNVLDPWLVLNNQGADALRWAIYTASPPWTTSRIGTNTVTDAFRQFLLMIRNIYNFFTMYANVDKFDPTAVRIPLENRHYLDKWIISELNTLIDYVHNQMKVYGITPATRAVGKFVDDLANWYIRRSRRRFWKSESDQDKNCAHQTLYEVLVTLTKLLSPFTPYIAERFYQSLVAPHFPNEPDSVHLVDLPVADKTAINPDLEREMGFIRDVVSVGLKARKSIKVKVRQPLQSITVRCNEKYQETAIEKYQELILDELNIKEVKTRTTLDDFCIISVKPNLKTLGRRFGSKMPDVKKIIESFDGQEVLRRLEESGKLTVKLDGDFDLDREDILIERKSDEGCYIESDGNIDIMLSTTITPELKEEGLVREIVRMIQGLRKDANLKVDEKIKTYISGSNDICEAINSKTAYVQKETLSAQISFKLEDCLLSQEFELEGEKVTIGIARMG
ncbi:MAG TPA: isoleucine--tRNA ligase [Caldisericia bacterium]|nr:isoleucine--tRNA ligase [Caldisericia bacterium]HPF48285.1 isoleucine--tRNA ligase [Caldisericia bacterium]HPI83536.1 isoleucine--tRNA ligase [Caldisericia bacterium]HPQ92738.1 isoleucine--tRNA ligase [Caldisericia bacterium]HRV74164.1 isoleucine--tRNA ligase [Caldisericia bacterium]